MSKNHIHHLKMSCQAKTKNGSDCVRKTQDDNLYCHQHFKFYDRSMTSLVCGCQYENSQKSKKITKVVFCDQHQSGEEIIEILQDLCELDHYIYDTAEKTSVIHQRQEVLRKNIKRQTMSLPSDTFNNPIREHVVKRTRISIKMKTNKE